LKIRVLAVGKLRRPHWAEAANDYLHRLRHYLDIEIIEIKDRVGRGREDVEAVNLEGRGIQRALRKEARLVVLDINGRQYSSENFSRWLKNSFENGERAIDFVLGGPLGPGAEIMQRADERLSLSAMTVPHELARIMLLEQLYRACTILRGENYHK
jgi:23S rRNA (pseudouridine1915-N3)-methyltransferase